MIDIQLIISCSPVESPVLLWILTRFRGGAKNGRYPERAAAVVRMKGLEPLRPKTLDPKSNAATNYATRAFASQS